MVIGVPLQFEQQIVCETMRSVPTMQNGNFLVLAVWKLLPQEAIMLDVVDGFEVDDSEEGDKRVDDQWLQPKDQIRHNCISHTC